MRGNTSGRTHCQIVPPYLLEAIAAADDERFRVAAVAARTALDRGIRPTGPAPQPPRAWQGEKSEGSQRTISDAEHLEKLPGVTVRREGERPVDDDAVNEAYDGLGDTYELYDSAYGRDSIDGHGMPLPATVHYGEGYDNAFWDGERMVFGDGDGQVFNRFTIAVDVIGHELTHGVTDATARLAYEDESGALNESISDVFGSLVAQYSLRQDAAAASWLIGEGLFTAEVQGVALRSMKAPGTAYDDDVLGKDPQPAHMRDYVHTSDDNGGVHINSGIPNHAFYLATTAIGGNAWEAAGTIWYDALTSGSVPKRSSFVQFAALTVKAASDRFGADAAQTGAVRGAWNAVGVIPEQE